MGWKHQLAPGHEGGLVGLVHVDHQTGAECDDGCGRWRELQYPDDQIDRPAGSPRRVRAIQAACDCGWRSARVEAPYSAAYFPYVVVLGDADAPLREQLRSEWEQHAIAHTRAGRPVVP